jgi:hypothetical protein
MTQQSAPWTVRAGIAIAILGALMVIVGAVAYARTSTALQQAQISVPGDACLGGEVVAGPFTAYCRSTTGSFVQESALPSFRASTLAFAGGIVLMLVGAGVGGRSGSPGRPTLSV